MESEDKQECVSLDMPNGLEANIKYPQKFVYPKRTYSFGSTNEAARKVDAAKVMQQTIKAR